MSKLDGEWLAHMGLFYCLHPDVISFWVIRWPDVGPYQHLNVKLKYGFDPDIVFADILIALDVQPNETEQAAIVRELGKAVKEVSPVLSNKAA